MTRPALPVCRPTRAPVTPRGAACAAALLAGALLAAAVRPAGAQGGQGAAPPGAAPPGAPNDSARAAPKGAGGDTAKSARLRVLPVFGSAPETGLVGGVTAFRVFRPRERAAARPAPNGPGAPPRDTAAPRPSVDQLFTTVSVRGQVRLFLERDMWRRNDTLRLNARVEFQHFPQPFFGIGPGTPASAEEWYTPTTFGGFASAQRLVARGLYAGLTYRFVQARLSDREEDGVLARLARDNALPGARGGRVGQLEATLAADTRDNIFAPRGGHFVQFAAGVARGVTGSQFPFQRAALDARLYRAVARRTVVAAQATAEAAAGTVPFDQLPAAGSASVLRGYVLGRFRDRLLVSGQVEVRQALPLRFGAVAWAGAGAVAPRVGALRADQILPTAGVGLRWALLPRERANLRVDYGLGSGGARGIYVGFAEAF